MRLVKFITLNGAPIFLNPDVVECVRCQTDTITDIRMQNGEEHSVFGGVEITVIKLTNGFARPVTEEHTT